MKNYRKSVQINNRLLVTIDFLTIFFVDDSILNFIKLKTTLTYVEPTVQDHNKRRNFIYVNTSSIAQKVKRLK